MNKRHFLIFASLFTLVSCADKVSVAPAIPLDKKLEKRVQNTLKSMSTREKAGQLVQISILQVLDREAHDLDDEKLTALFRDYKIGSLLNVPFDIAHDREYTADMLGRIQEKSMELIGIPCVYGLDMIHGATYLSDGTFFPQEINLAASFNPVHAANMGKVLAYETRAAMCPWTFSPVMDLTRNPAWSRNWESYGEDPYLQSVMASTETLAIQGEDPNSIDCDHVAVSIKHYMAYGATRTGKDRTPAVVPYNELREKYFAPFKACIEAGALTLMVNSASINGVPMHANKELLDWVKVGLNWDGMIVTDWADIDNLYSREHIATDKKDAIRIGINAGIDMIMDPYDPKAVDLIEELVNEGEISKARLDDAASRVIRLKYRLGLFDQPVWDSESYDCFGGQEFKDMSLAAAIESEVLLKNEGVLPIAKGTRILVTGPNANSMRSLNGGWSYQWQGSSNPEFYKSFNTIYAALANKFGESKVKFVPGVVYDERSNMWNHDMQVGIDKVVAAARNSDVIVACIGENSYCETPGNLNDLHLSPNQTLLVSELARTGKPIVLVLNGGRPRVISDIEPLAKAVVDVMLPSNYGGDALAELLSGDANFSAKLPFTYPKHVNSLHTYDSKVSEQVSRMAGSYDYDAVLDVQWPFGAGLSYTSFEYSNLKASKSEFTADDSLEFSVDVTNTGKVAGKEAVILYSSDLVASLIPDIRRVRAFDKITLEPGETKTVKLTVPASDLAFVAVDGRWTLEEGKFVITVGGEHTEIDCTKTKVW